MSVSYNLALVTDDPAEREARFRQVADQREALLGANHPRTLSARLAIGSNTRNPVAAAANLQSAWNGYQRWHPQLGVEIANATFERAWLADERGDATATVAAMQVAANDPLSPRERGKGAIAASYIAIASDNHISAAIRTMEDLATTEADAREFWTRGEAADAYVTAALGWDRLGKASEAERCWSAALALLETIRQPFFDRRLAHVRATLAR